MAATHCPAGLVRGLAGLPWERCHIESSRQRWPVAARKPPKHASYLACWHVCIVEGAGTLTGEAPRSCHRRNAIGAPN